MPKTWYMDTKNKSGNLSENICLHLVIYIRFDEVDCKLTGFFLGEQGSQKRGIKNSQKMVPPTGFRIKTRS